MRQTIIGGVIVAFVIVASLVAPASAALPSGAEFTSMDGVSRWMASYRTRPDPARLPAAVRALSQSGAFKEPEGAGVYPDGPVGDCARDCLFRSSRLAALAAQVR
jgi:hypothetical protein